MLIRIQTLNLLGQDIGDAIWLALLVLLPRAATFSISSDRRITLKSATADAGAAGLVELSESGCSSESMVTAASLLWKMSPQLLSTLEISQTKPVYVTPLLCVLPMLTALQTLDLCYTCLGPWVWCLLLP